MSAGRKGILAVGLVAGLLAAAFGISWWTDSQEIRFVFPERFQGGFIIIEDPSGTDLGSRFARKFVVHVPSSRVIKVKSFFPFHRMHATSVQVGANGPLLLVNYLASNEEISLRGGSIGDQAIKGVRYRQRIWLVWGTAAEEEAFDPWPLFPKS